MWRSAQPVQSREVDLLIDEARAKAKSKFLGAVVPQGHAGLSMRRKQSRASRGGPHAFGECRLGWAQRWVSTRRALANSLSESLPSTLAEVPVEPVWSKDAQLREFKNVQERECVEFAGEVEF